MVETTIPAPAARQEAILSVQVMRGLAALAVVFYHTHLILAQPEYGGRDIFGAIASKGWVGVNFFFVLSGFIILLAHRKDVGRISSVPRYLWRRVVRLYPLYWLCLTAYILAAGLSLGNADFSWDPLNLLSSYLLVDAGPGQTLPLKVAWTLLYEVRFYLIFALLILSSFAGWAAMGLWLVGILVANTIVPGLGGGLFSLWSLYFFFGMAACLLVPRLHDRWGAPILIGGLAILAVALVPINYGIADGEKNAVLLLTLALGFTLVLMGAILCERRFGWQPPRILLLLGDASYAIYLVHSAVLSVVALLAHKLLPQIDGALLFFSALVVATAVGIVVHLTIERPLLASLRRREPGRAHRMSQASDGTPAEALPK